MITAESLVNNNTTVYDFNYTTVNKDQLLDRVQYWKDYFTQRNVKTLNVQYYQGVNSIAIMLACLEKSITIYTCNYSKDKIDNTLPNVDLSIIGYSKKEMHNPSDPTSVLVCDNLLFNYKSKKYVAEQIDNNATLFTDGIKTYSVREFITAAMVGKSLFSIGQNVATIQYISHFETSAIWLMSPVMAGTNIYACGHVIDLSSLLYKGLVDVVCLYPMHLQTLYQIEKGVNTDSPFGLSSFRFELNNCVFVLTGVLPSPHICDWAKTRGASLIRNVFVHELVPCFISDITNEMVRLKLDTPVTGIQYQVNNSNELLVNIENIDNNNKGWHNTKNFVEVVNGTLFLKGNKKINNRYVLDVQDFICGIVADNDIGKLDFALECVDNCLTVKSFRQYVHNKFVSVQDTLTMELLNFSHVANVQYDYVDKSQIWKI